MFLLFNHFFLYFLLCKMALQLWGAVLFVRKLHFNYNHQIKALNLHRK